MRLRGAAVASRQPRRARRALPASRALCAAARRAPGPGCARWRGLARVRRARSSAAGPARSGRRRRHPPRRDADAVVALEPRVRRELRGDADARRLGMYLAALVNRLATTCESRRGRVGHRPVLAPHGEAVPRPREAGSHLDRHRLHFGGSRLQPRRCPPRVMRETSSRCRPGVGGATCRSMISRSPLCSASPELHDVQCGGRWVPAGCAARDRAWRGTRPWTVRASAARRSSTRRRAHPARPRRRPPPTRAQGVG